MRTLMRRYASQAGKAVRRNLSAVLGVCAVLPAVLGVSTPTHAAGKMIGYWASWNSPNLYAAAANYDIICFAFGASGGTDGATITMPYTPESPAQIQNDIGTLQWQGKKVLLSVGGAGVTIKIQSAADELAFVNSIKALKSQYWFDGIDLDIENGCLNLNAGDNDINNPTTPSTVYLIAALNDLRTYYGSSFMITMAPQTADIDAYNNWGTSGGIGWGDYLPLINKTRSIISYVMIQNYDSGTQFGLDWNIYTEGTSDFNTAMCEFLLYGFTVNNPTHQWFSALNQSQVVMGVPATSAAAGTGGGYLSPTGVNKSVKYLRYGTSYGGSYHLLGGPYPNLGGVMTWNCNYDYSAGYPMASVVAPVVHL